MPKESFSKENSLAFHSEQLQHINRSGLTGNEVTFATLLTLRAIGEALYDKEDVSPAAVRADYKTSPSWAAVLMLVADMPLELLRVFQKEASDPEGNAKVWKEFLENFDGTTKGNK